MPNVAIVVTTREDGSIEVKKLGGELTKTGVEGEKSAKKTTKAWDKVQSKSKGWTKSIKGLASSWLGVTAAVTLFVKLAKDSSDAFQVQEKAEKDLAAALKITGELTKENIDILEDFAAARQKVTTFGDEITLQNLSLLASFKMNTAQMQRSTIAAQDLSVGLGLDLKASTLLLGKAFLGETSTLSRYGIIIEEGLGKAEKFEAVLNQLQQRFGGRATAEIETNAGKINQLSDTWGDFTEKLGAFTPVVVLALEGLLGIVKVITDLGTGIGEVASKIGEFFSTTNKGASGVKDNVAGIADKIEKVAESSEEAADRIKKAFEELDIFPRETFERQARKELDAFTTLIELGIISSNEDRIIAQKALFDELEKISKDAGQRIVGIHQEIMGPGEIIKRFDEESGTLTVTIGRLGDQLARDFEDIGTRMAKGIVEVPGRTITTLGDTTRITLNRTVQTIESFIDETLALARTKFPILSDIFQQQVDVAIEAEQAITTSVSEQTRKRTILYEDAYSVILKDTSNFVRDMIERLNRIPEETKRLNELSVSIPSTSSGSLPPLPVSTFIKEHDGGILKSTRKHGGLRADEVPFVGLDGEGVVSRQGMSVLGRGNLDLLNRGQNVSTNDNRRFDQRQTTYKFYFEGAPPQDQFETEMMHSKAQRQAARKALPG